MHIDKGLRLRLIRMIEGAGHWANDCLGVSWPAAFESIGLAVSFRGQLKGFGLV